MTPSMENIYLPEGQSPVSGRNRETVTSLQGLEHAMETGAILEGAVLLCDHDFNLHVDLPHLPGVVGIIPREEAVYTRPGEAVKDIAILTRVGKTVCFKVTDLTYRDGEVIARLSRRRAQADCLHNYLSALQPGDIIPARVTHLESFGAFVDVGCGLPALLSVDAISVSRIAHPRDRLYNGQLIRVVVRHLDRSFGTHDADPGRIFVSMRELLGTWEENAARFQAGQTVAGTVRSVEDYGVFVELAPNLAGLAELRDPQHEREAVEAMIGRRAAVFIKSILPERMKIKLVLIDAYKGDAPPAPRLTYFVPESVTHIDQWVYSPAGAKRRVESLFPAE